MTVSEDPRRCTAFSSRKIGSTSAVTGIVIAMMVSSEQEPAPAEAPKCKSVPSRDRGDEHDRGRRERIHERVLHPAPEEVVVEAVELVPRPRRRCRSCRRQTANRSRAGSRSSSARAGATAAAGRRRRRKGPARACVAPVRTYYDHTIGAIWEGAAQSPSRLLAREDPPAYQQNAGRAACAPRTPVERDAPTCRRPRDLHCARSEAGRPAASGERTNLVQQQSPVPRLQRQREHHVAEHEPAAQDHAPDFRECELLCRIVEMVERVVGHDDVERLVVEWQGAHVSLDQSDVRERFVDRARLETVEHPSRDVERNDARHSRRELERDEAGSGSEIENAVVATRLGHVDDSVAKHAKGVGRGNLFPCLDASVPVVRIVGVGRRAQSARHLKGTLIGPGSRR